MLWAVYGLTEIKSSLEASKSQICEYCTPIYKSTGIGASILPNSLVTFFVNSLDPKSFFLLLFVVICPRIFLA